MLKTRNKVKWAFTTGHEWSFYRDFITIYNIKVTVHISTLSWVIYKGNIHVLTLTQYTRWKPESISCDRHKKIPMLVVTYVLDWHTLAQRTVNLTVRSRKSIIKFKLHSFAKNTWVKTVPLTKFAKSDMKQCKKTGHWLPFVFTPGFGQADTCKVALQQNAFYLIIKAVINVSGASTHSWMVIEILISIINNERRVNFTAHKLLECLWHMALVPWQFWPLSNSCNCSL